MAEYTLQTVRDGEVVEESRIELKKQDILIANVPKNMTTDQTKRMHENIKDALESTTTNITLPEYVVLQVLKIK